MYQLGYGIKTNEVERLYSTISELVSLPNRSEVYQERRKRMLGEKIDLAEYILSIKN